MNLQMSWKQQMTIKKMIASTNIRFAYFAIWRGYLTKTLFDNRIIHESYMKINNSMMVNNGKKLSMWNNSFY